MGAAIKMEDTGTTRRNDWFQVVVDIKLFTNLLSVDGIASYACFSVT